MLFVFENLFNCPHFTEENAARQDNLEVLGRSWYPAQTWRLLPKTWLILAYLGRWLNAPKFAADFSHSNVFGQHHNISGISTLRSQRPFHFGTESCSCKQSQFKEAGDTLVVEKSSLCSGLMLGDQVSLFQQNQPL